MLHACTALLIIYTPRKMLSTATLISKSPEGLLIARVWLHGVRYFLHTFLVIKTVSKGILDSMYLYEKSTYETDFILINVYVTMDTC